MDSDRARWDERYRARLDDEPAPSAAAPDVLIRHPELLEHMPTSGTALDVACGIGAQAMWLADRGLSVIALDVSPIAIDALRHNAAHVRRAIDARVADTDDGLSDELTDLDAIVCQRYRSTDLYPDLVARLAPSGVLLLTVLSSVGLDGTPGAFHADAGELLDAFGSRDDAEVLHHGEAGGVADIVLQKR